MRRLSCILMAIALLAGCEKAETGRGVERSSTVHFSVGTMQTFVGEGVKSTGDGSGATQLLVGVFDAAGNAIDGYGKVVNQTAGTFNFDLDLVNGLTYKIVLFAQSPGRYVTDGWTNSSLKDITLSFSALSSEADDAFAAVKTLTVDGTVNVQMQLSRIFAQVNMASTLDPGTAAVTLRLAGMPTSYNALTGEFSGESDAVFTGTAKGGSYMEYDYYLGYAYVPVRANATATITLSDDSGVLRSKEVGSLPLKANYRTNILGSI